jgi:hypothetical protein
MPASHSLRSWLAREEQIVNPRTPSTPALTPHSPRYANKENEMVGGEEEGKAEEKWEEEKWEREDKGVEGGEEETKEEEERAVLATPRLEVGVEVLETTAWSPEAKGEEGDEQQFVVVEEDSSDDE